MNRYFFRLLSFSILLASSTRAQWRPLPGKITTEWTEKVDPDNPLPDYPRPQLTRKTWKNLNGLWQYSILPKSAGDSIPSSWAGQILVPFAIESTLSGVGKTVGSDSVLWYRRTMEIPGSMRKNRILLHFGAVDWSAQVYVNGIKVGVHEGGYDAFSFDITNALKKGVTQTIAVHVWDPTDDGPQPQGKQVKKPGGIWYTSVTGIWQTVWLEEVPPTYIESTRQTPDIDKQQLSVSVKTVSLQTGDEINITAWDGDRQIAEQTSPDGNNLVLSIPNAKLWSPQTPFLYDLKISIKRKGKPIDETGSYFGMRKSSIEKDGHGVQRMMLNNKFLFQYGPLDQGWWPDGLYTAPTDEALRYDLEKIKSLGFNMVRKHVKVEPARWYYFCDKMGLLVWQDMPSGDRGGNGWDSKPGIISGGNGDKDRKEASSGIYRKEWQAILDELFNYPSIIVWVPFNEAWGQFKTREIADWTAAYDPSRLVNAASGGNYFAGAGQIMDLHNYPNPAMPDPQLFGDRQALVLGEFGGLGLPVEGHTWLDKGNWGYRSYKDREDLFTAYSGMIDNIPRLITLGLSGAIYTQLTDVEVETNGILTYDRKVIKMPEERMNSLHQKLYDEKLIK